MKGASFNKVDFTEDFVGFFTAGSKILSKCLPENSLFLSTVFPNNYPFLPFTTCKQIHVDSSCNSAQWKPSGEAHISPCSLNWRNPVIRCPANLGYWPGFAQETTFIIHMWSQYIFIFQWTLGVWFPHLHSWVEAAIYCSGDFVSDAFHCLVHCWHKAMVILTKLLDHFYFLFLV